MECQYFGKCGGCNLGGISYEEQLQIKIDQQKENFQDIYSADYDIIKSEDGLFRNRAEFRIWKIYDDENNFELSYAMNSIEKNILPIESCSIVSEKISNIMPLLIEEVSNDEILHMKFFSIEFFGSLDGDLLVTMIYHKKLDENWNEKANLLAQKLDVKIIGRSRKQKVILSEDKIDEKLTINNDTFYFQYKEGGFTQPNQRVNEQMIEWVLDNIDSQDDLCELYCGGGNFTIPLSKQFNKVLATEISKTSINSAKVNCQLNDIENIKFIRLAAQEFVEARKGVREFRRLKQENVSLEDYNFSTIFVDPPRAGLDDTTRELCKEFEQIIYISCNPETLKRDLETLTKTHKIEKFAFFDQFAYSTHIESGVILSIIH
jgi:tRNA (uracil-5-)-methyltransferase